jgi:hypothetical protein
LANLGHRLSDQTVGNILRRHGMAPAPKRSQTTSWKAGGLGKRKVGPSVASRLSTRTWLGCATTHRVFRPFLSSMT